MELISTSDLFLTYRMAFNKHWAEVQSTTRHIETPIRNVRKTYDEGKFWLFDNEMATFEGYKYLYSDYTTLKHTDWYWIHEKILRSLCLFKRETIENIKRLANMKAPDEYLMAYVREKEPLYHLLESQHPISDFTRRIFEKRFRERLKYVVAWVEYCRRL